MKNELVEEKRGEIYTTSVEVAEKLEVKHRDLLRTIERISSHGLEEEIIPDMFKNKMNRKYPCYRLSPRVIIMLETIFLFQGYGDSNGYNKPKGKYTDPEYVYIFQSLNGIYKIGSTSNVKNRLSAIQIGSCDFIEVFATIRGGKELEAILHARFKDKHISGEWFSINEEDIYNIYLDYKLKFQYYDTLLSILFELGHSCPKDTKELEITDFTSSKNYKVLRRLKDCLVEGMKRELPYPEIYRYAKEEVNKLVDSLCFNPVDINSKYLSKKAI